METERTEGGMTTMAVLPTTVHLWQPPRAARGGGCVGAFSYFASAALPDSSWAMVLAILCPC